MRRAVPIVAGMLVTLTACGGGLRPNADAGVPVTLTPSAPAVVSPSAIPTVYTGPTVTPGTKCGTVTVVAGAIQCSHALVIFQLYALKKAADGSASFNGWTCHRSTTVTGIVCDRAGVRLLSAG